MSSVVEGLLGIFTAGLVVVAAGAVVCDTSAGLVSGNNLVSCEIGPVWVAEHSEEDEEKSKRRSTLLPPTDFNVRTVFRFTGRLSHLLISLGSMYSLLEELLPSLL